MSARSTQSACSAASCSPAVVRCWSFPKAPSVGRRIFVSGGYVVIGQDCDAHGQPVFPPVGVSETQLDRSSTSCSSTATPSTCLLFALEPGALRLVRQMNVVGGPSELPLPKNVGLLFFNERPAQFFPATQVDVVWFPEGAGGDRFEEKTSTGPARTDDTRCAPIHSAQLSTRNGHQALRSSRSPAFLELSLRRSRKWTSRAWIRAGGRRFVAGPSTR